MILKWEMLMKILIIFKKSKKTQNKNQGQKQGYYFGFSAEGQRGESSCANNRHLKQHLKRCRILNIILYFC